MGQARARGTKEERVVQAMQASKLNPKQKKLNKGQIRALAMSMALDVVSDIFSGSLTKRR